MKGAYLRSVAWLPAIVAAAGIFSTGVNRAGEREPQVAGVVIRTSREDCTVDLDSAPVGKTDAGGQLALSAVEPGDHYVHIHCADEQERAYFISPQVGEKLEIRHGVNGAPALESTASPLEPAEIKIQLHRHIQDAVRLRARGRIEEAIRHLRAALRLDPENSDLHREMGITFLLGKEWKRARVEMLEAIRHGPADADAHNGLGYALEKLGELDAALTAYRTATHLEPDDASYRRHYLEALARLSAQQATKKK